MTRPRPRFTVLFTKTPDRGVFKGIRIRNQRVTFPTIRSARLWVRGVKRNSTISDVRLDES